MKKCSLYSLLLLKLVGICGAESFSTSARASAATMASGMVTDEGGWGTTGWGLASVATPTPPAAGAAAAAAPARPFGRRLRSEIREPLRINANYSIEEIAHLLLDEYENHHRPGYSGAPTVVEINMFVQSFGSINVIDMDYSIDILLRQKWRDPRLQFVGYNHSLSLSYLKEKLWIPDLFFRNAKHGFLHVITTPNYLIWLQSDGLVTFSQKLTIRLACPMQLWNFPMDTQLCPLEIGSYGFAVSDLQFVWMRKGPSVSLNKQMMLNEFELPSVRAGSCLKAYNATGAFTCLFVEFKLVRKFGFYLIYTYLPSILIVAISWISFWIDYKAVPARITLGLLSVLALMTQSAAAMQKLPRVSYIKAIDVWLFACLAFVVASLLEFALVNMLARRQEQRQLRDELRGLMRKELTMLGGNLVSGKRLRQPDNNSTRKQPLKDDNGGGDGGGGGTGGSSDCASEIRRPLRLRMARGADGEIDTDGGIENGGEGAFEAERVDNLCAFAYPICFMLFNLVYWLTYMLYKDGGASA